MFSHLRFTVLIPLAAVLGCTLPTTSSTNPPVSGDWTNWQIQAGSAITSPPTGISFVGAVQTSGTQSAAVFTAATGLPTTSNPTQVLDFLGTYNSSTGTVDLLPGANGPYLFALNFTQSSSPYTVVPVGVTGGCIYPLNYQGPECLAITSVPSVGVEVAPLTATYTGTLSVSCLPTTNSCPVFSGPTTLTLTQSSTPNSNGAFPLTGTITFPSDSGFALGSDPLGGTVSGEGVSMSYISTAVIGPAVNLTASTNPAGTQINVSNLTWAETGPSFTFTGTLTLQ